MRISQLLQIAPRLYKNGISVHLFSQPGIGKSQVIENDIPKAIRKGLGLESFNVFMPPALSSLEAPDVRGFTVPVQDPDGGRMRTASTVSPLIPPADLGPNGIVFLDEVSQGSQDVNKPTASFRLDGRVGEDSLLEDWAVWCASNRMTDRSGVVKPMMHVVNRELQIHLEFHIDDWRTWAHGADIPLLFIAFAMFKSGLIAQDVPKTPEPFSTPRSYARYAQLIHDISDGDVGSALADRESGLGALALELGCGMVGKAVATEALAFMRVADEMPTWSQLCQDPVGTAKSLPRGRMDVVFSVCSMVVHNADIDSVPQCFEFATALPKEFQVSTLKNILEKKDADDEPYLAAALSTVPGFTQWATQNPGLIMGSYM